MTDNIRQLGFHQRSGFYWALMANLLLLYVPAAALDERRLWLPVRYQSLYLPLVKAAQRAEALDRCVTVMEGTMDIEQSRPGHPIFRILCRQPNGHTYNEMVDGLTFTTLTTPAVVERELTQEEQELLRQQEQARRQAEIAARKTEAWEFCRRKLVYSTRMMLSLQWLVDLEGLPEPEVFEEDNIRFRADFDARNMQGELLHFTAECRVAGELADVRLRKR